MVHGYYEPYDPTSMNQFLNNYVTENGLNVKSNNKNIIVEDNLIKFPKSGGFIIPRHIDPSQVVIRLCQRRIYS